MRARRELVKHRVALCNQLRAHLQATLPGAVGLFKELDSPISLAFLAGVAPSTRQSGKHRAVTFRWAVNKELRDAVCDFAGDSRRANPWAARIYDDAIARGKDHPHATRILARAWLGVIWRCWQDDAAYEPARHHALQAMRVTATAA